MTVAPADLLTGPDWQHRIDALAAKHGVPGVQVGLLALDGDDADVRVLGSGVTSTSTGVPVTPRTVFHYGSITKVWTTTLVLQLVDDGLLTLDTPVTEVLPGFATAVPGHAERITVRHLLTHTAGIDGDVFTDTGDGDDCVAKYVDALAGAVSITEPGGPFSYANSGFVVAGRIVEVLRGQVWDDVLAERLLRPLGLTHVITRFRDAPLHRAAVGHHTDPDTGVATATTRWHLPRSIGPAGIAVGDSADLLAFLAAHLRGGVGLTGERVLSEESALLMRREHVDLSALSTTTSGWGLGWMRSDWGADTAVHHNGGTIGQIAESHSFPGLGLALCVLTNSDRGTALADELEAEIAAEFGLTPPKPTAGPDAAEADLSALAGVYETPALRCVLDRTPEGGLTISLAEKTVIAGAAPMTGAVTPLAANRFAFDRAGAVREFAHLVHEGREYLYAGRLFARVG
ncbi:serine hydrolase domain-containing protein [Actinosynnema sp. NPDC020468]|uniref:serine hydrolase domain-containing protein n=1 Tax=Actinosynnema sp. NPDC020468 TaxID=3154488 RepID=UPI0033EE9064